MAFKYWTFLPSWVARLAQGTLASCGVQWQALICRPAVQRVPRSFAAARLQLPARHPVAQCRHSACHRWGRATRPSRVGQAIQEVCSACAAAKSTTAALLNFNAAWSCKHGPHQPRIGACCGPALDCVHSGPQERLVTQAPACRHRRLGAVCLCSTRFQCRTEWLTTVLQMTHGKQGITAGKCAKCSAQRRHAAVASQQYWLSLPHFAGIFWRHQGSFDHCQQPCNRSQAGGKAITERKRRKCEFAMDSAALAADASAEAGEQGAVAHQAIEFPEQQDEAHEQSRLDLEREKHKSR